MREDANAEGQGAALPIFTFFLSLNQGQDMKNSSSRRLCDRWPSPMKRQLAHPTERGVTNDC